jgi:hypothetical protein
MASLCHIPSFKKVKILKRFSQSVVASLFDAYINKGHNPLWRITIVYLMDIAY